MNLLKKFTIPPVSLPKIATTESAAFYDRASVKLEHLSKEAGKSSKGFQYRIKKLRNLAHKGIPLEKHVKTFADIRALIHLWDNDPDFIEIVPVSRDWFVRFNEISNLASRLTLLAMVGLYFNKYDLLESGLSDLQKYLSNQLKKRKKKTIPPSLSGFVSNSNIILQDTAHKAVVDHGLNLRLPLDELLKKCDVPQGRTNRFSTLCQHIYYIENLKRLPLGGHSRVLPEIVKKQVYETIFDEKTLLGHQVLQIMIDKGIKFGSRLPDNWLDVVMMIAQDPRVPTGNFYYRRWWNVIGKKRTDWVRNQLSSLDLKVFLEVLEDYAENSGKDDIKRMFPARKKFLEGLFNLKLVINSRLFLGNKAVAFLNRSYNDKSLPHYATQSDSDKAIIYLNLGRLHIIEGTHSFPLIMMDELPSSSTIMSYEHDHFAKEDLNKNLLKAHDQLSMRSPGMHHQNKITHHPNLNWQHKALQAMKRYGMNVNPGEVLTKEDHQNFKNNPKYNL